MRCQDCKFYKDILGHSGECRKETPTIVFEANKSMNGFWPEVYFDDWCGEYQMANDRVLIGKDVKKKDICDCRAKGTDNEKEFGDHHAESCPKFMPF